MIDNFQLLVETLKGSKEDDKVDDNKINTKADQVDNKADEIDNEIVKKMLQE